MLCGIRQNDMRLKEPIRKYGCLFLCFAAVSPLIFEGDAGCNALNHMWDLCVSEGKITGDLNGDGDMDDENEAVIVSHNGVARFFLLNCHYDGLHHAAEENVPSNVQYVFGQYFYKSGHFVVLNRNKEVIFDSLGYSNTVMNGKLKSMRWYYAN